MKKQILLILAAFLTIICYAQNFEGKIIYSNSYLTKSENLKSEQMSEMMGNKQDYYIKGGNYKSITNGSYFQWQLYLQKENMVYTKMSISDTILSTNAATQDDSVISFTLNKNVTKILEYNCDELIFVCKSGIQKYYFNTSLKVESKLFINHIYGNWYEFVSRSNSLPLKTIIENNEFIWESVAISILPLKLENRIFDLPIGAKIGKISF